MRQVTARKVFGAFCFAACIMLATPPAQAKLMFGNDETIHHIADVKLKGAKDEALAIAYKTSMQFFFAGIYVSDDGYVLGVKDESKRYYKMPTGAELAGFQKRGLLPDPLPPYSLSMFDYIFGYSLWIILGLFALWGLFKFLRRERDEPDATPPVRPA